MEKISVDFEYLTTDLPSWERNKVINGDEEARKRADAFREAVGNFIREIEQLYYLDNKEPGEIADHFFRQQGPAAYTPEERQELIEYVERVIRSKLNK
ncbi:MAG TPA: hypothetical protein VHK69_02605 [Chitinophagaceae bacterium]|nr:hypothetical protein [Chitinophagaceae bacterium]